MFKRLYLADKFSFRILSADYIFAKTADKAQEQKVSAGYKYLNAADTQKMTAPQYNCWQKMGRRCTRFIFCLCLIPGRWSVD
jgi:hypothetical protein